MASSYNKWSKEEVSEISLFWRTDQPVERKIKDDIDRKLINALQQPEDALGQYLQLVDKLPIPQVDKTTLKTQYYSAVVTGFRLPDPYTLLKEMLIKVTGKNGNESKVGIFLDAMDAIGWKGGSDIIVAQNWGEIKGLTKPEVKIKTSPSTSSGNGEDVVDTEGEMVPFPDPKSPLDEGFFEFDPNQAEIEPSDGSTSVEGYFEGEILKVNVVPAKEGKSGNGIYKMSNNPRGVALILNNTFENKKGGRTQNSARDGCEHDERYVGDLFHQFGFKIFVAKNVAKSRFPAVMAKYRSLITPEMDCFIFVIMSHGELNTIHMADREFMNIYTDFLPEITTKMGRLFCEKPKLVFFQACQTLDKKKIEVNDGSSQSKTKAEYESVEHVRLFYPSLPADVARRQPATGSRFIYALVKVFMEQAHEKEIDELRNEVAIVMRDMKLPPGFERQVPRIEMHGVCHKLYFNPGL